MLTTEKLKKLKKKSKRPSRESNPRPPASNSGHQLVALPLRHDRMPGSRREERLIPYYSVNENPTDYSFRCLNILFFGCFMFFFLEYGSETVRLTFYNIFKDET